MVTGHGAGFVMCWQNDVQLTITEDEDPRNFMIVKSGSYVLAIPDLNHYARHENDAKVATRPESSSSVSSRRQRAVFKKTVMKLNGNVRWGVGLVFERNLDNGQRSFNSYPITTFRSKTQNTRSRRMGRYATHSSLVPGIY
jgi:hypothetical protein